MAGGYCPVAQYAAAIRQDSGEGGVAWHSAKINGLKINHSDPWGDEAGNLILSLTKSTGVELFCRQ
jgi:hypothetical protein